ncbi:bifunctional metallophosphatase/5'-nucleotidase [Brevibacillus sp. B_LB10_24]|uniref:bifunctional metallophosphatase/5'-nucleotidase n=1 Tax=Brevibacillus sp. B_LB10_24 TaxID=3380645 RepID=UPI0038B7CE93
MKKLRRSGITLLSAVLTTGILAGPAFAAPLQPIDHVQWLKEKSFMIGDDKGSLALEQNVSLAEVIAVISRLKDADVKPDSSNWAAPYIAWGQAQGVLTAEDAKNGYQAASASKIKEIAKGFGYTLNLADKPQVTRGEFAQALGDAATLHITIAHTNDVHGHIEENQSGKEFGYAKIATLLKEWRGENDNFLLMDAGDTFQGTVFANQFKGESIVPILNQLSYNAGASGNHEFDFGYEQLLKLKDMVNYPIIASNVFKADGTNLLPPVYKTEIGGKKFAFIGFVTEDTPIVTHPDNVKGLTFKNPVEIAKQLVPEMKKEVDHVVVVSHIGVEVDREIAKNVDGIDLIIGGHSHTPIRTPEVVNGTYIVQDWEYGKSLGRVDMYYLGDEMVAFSGGLKEYDETVKPDPEIEKLVKDVVAKVDEIMNVVIGKAAVDLDGDRTLVRTRETNLGNFVTDAMLERTKSIPGHEADVALTNGGGIRAQVKAGDITKKDLYTVFPFPNTLVVVEATGEELRQALEDGVSKVEEQQGRFPQISGMSFTYNPSKPAGERIVEVKVGGQPLDPNKTYKVATNDFIAAGGDGYESLHKEGFNTGITLYDLMEEAIKEKKEISPKVENRIVEVK